MTARASSKDKLPKDDGQGQDGEKKAKGSRYQDKLPKEDGQGLKVDKQAKESRYQDMLPKKDGYGHEGDKKALDLDTKKVLLQNVASH